MRKELCVLTVSNKVVKVDISNDVLDETGYGFRCGDRIVDPDGDRGTIIGTSFPSIDTLTIEVLWYALDRDNGKVTYLYPLQEGDLIRE